MGGPIWRGGPTERGYELLGLAAPVLDAADVFVDEAMKLPLEEGCPDAPAPAAPRSEPGPAEVKPPRLTATQMKVACAVVAQCGDDRVLKVDDAALAKSFGAKPQTIARAIDGLQRIGAFSRAKGGGIRVLKGLRAESVGVSRTGVLAAGMPIAPFDGGPVGVRVALDWASPSCEVRWPDGSRREMPLTELYSGYGKVSEGDVVMTPPAAMMRPGCGPQGPCPFA